MFSVKYFLTYLGTFAWALVSPNFLSNALIVTKNSVPQGTQW